MNTRIDEQCLQSTAMNSLYLRKKIKKLSFFELISPSSLPSLFFILFVGFYIFCPFIVCFYLEDNKYMFMFAEISTLSALGLLLGYFVFSNFFFLAKPLHLFKIKGKNFVWFIFIVFIILLILIITTADSVPLFLAFKTRDVYQLAVARANFLKARTGIEHLLVYANAALTSSFLPYVILLSFFRNYPYRWIYLTVPYCYSFLTLEKVFFLKFILPFISFGSSMITKRPEYKKYGFLAALSIPLLIYINTIISGPSVSTIEYHKELSVKYHKELSKKERECLPHFYSANYIQCASQERLKFITWRMLAVPVFTAADSLKLFEEKYQNQLFLGKTSSLLSMLFGMQNIKFERETFSSEWGQDTTGTASANSVFVIEQFVNFGWLGVILSSIMLGFMSAALRRSNDLALASISIVLFLSLIVGGLISTMLSGGFLALFTFLYLVKLDE